uniref:Uncharacterized protein n=1 Tax=Strombidium inclinatum TaxID=197538 RepID=A0A7S3MYI8_9SPIT
MNLLHFHNTEAFVVIRVSLEDHSTLLQVLLVKGLLFQLLLFLVAVVRVVEGLELEGEEEGRTSFVFGKEVDDAVELVHYQFADHEAEADALSVQLLLLVFDRTEQLEQFRLVLLLDAHAGVHDSNTKEGLLRPCSLLRLATSLVLH